MNTVKKKDNEYFAYRDGKLVDVPTIDKLCLALKDKFMRQFEKNILLEEELEKLKNGVWENEEIARRKAENERLKEENRYGFPISKKEHEAINKFISENNLPRTTIGGGFTYTFVPTSIGVIGEIECVNGNKLKFRDL